MPRQRCRAAIGAGVVALIVLSGCDRGSGAAPALSTKSGPARSSAEPISSSSSATSTTAPPPAPLAPYTPPRTLPPFAGKPRALPLRYDVGNAQQAVVVTVPSADAEVGTVQGWVRIADGWAPITPPARASVGRSGVTRAPREGLAATPEGSFTITQAFGRLPNPGTTLAYFRTSPADWWISQAGPLYNTHQVCASDCPFTPGSPNTELAAVVPQYDLAMVIDYNRFPVRAGAGSGFFLHVTRGIPTNGCVSTDPQTLVRLMRWLVPSAQPRIVIGVSS